MVGRAGTPKCTTFAKKREFNWNEGGAKPAKQRGVRKTKKHWDRPHDKKARTGGQQKGTEKKTLGSHSGEGTGPKTAQKRLFNLEGKKRSTSIAKLSNPHTQTVERMT